LFGISKFPLTYVSSPQGERMEVRGLIYCMEFQSVPPYLINFLSPRGEDGGEGANLLFGISKL